MKKNLMIQWYDKLTEGVRSDIDIYLQEAKYAKQPILELAVGSGRILIELLENGIETHGLDISDEMLDICRINLSEKGLSTELHQMDMAYLDLQEKNYGMIFCSRATLQMLESRRELNSCLSNVYDHLDEDGLFVADMFIPWQGIIENQQDQWILGPVAHEGKETLICQSSNRYDLQEQLQHIIYKYELYKDSFLIETMIENYKLRWYGKEEFRLILEKIGFTDVEISKTNVFQKYDYGYIIRARK
jgi:ubiquinone/menaquinone biosynthesis C-methylase UbiE